MSCAKDIPLKYRNYKNKCYYFWIINDFIILLRCECASVSVCLQFLFVINWGLRGILISTYHFTLANKLSLTNNTKSLSVCGLYLSELNNNHSFLLATFLLLRIYKIWTNHYLTAKNFILHNNKMVLPLLPSEYFKWVVHSEDFACESAYKSHI